MDSRSSFQTEDRPSVSLRQCWILAVGRVLCSGRPTVSLFSFLLESHDWFLGLRFHKEKVLAGEGTSFPFRQWKRKEQKLPSLAGSGEYTARHSSEGIGL